MMKSQEHLLSVTMVTILIFAGVLISGENSAETSNHTVSPRMKNKGVWSDVDPFDWEGWGRDKNEDRMDDLLFTDLPRKEAIDGRVGVNIHLDHTPDDKDVKMLMSTMKNIGMEPEFLRTGKHSTAVYLLFRIEDIPRLKGISFFNGINMVEYRPKMTGMLDVSTRSIQARGSDLYSPFTVEDLGYNGEGVNIAIIDSGVDDTLHESLRGKYVYGVDFSGTTVISGRNPDDSDGHGTHCAGVAMGTGGFSEDYRGVSPGSGLVDLRHSRRIADITGAGDQALEWVIDNHEEYDIGVVSCSWGSSATSSGRDTTSRLVNQLVDEGVVVVVAAGNDGEVGFGSPASADSALTVGAMGDRGTTDRTDDYYESFSNYGPRSSDGDLDSEDELKPDILAPGRDINSAKHNSATGYVSKTGTSMSTPHVAGVAALMLDANPELTPEEIKNILRNTAYQDRGASLPDVDDKYNYRSGWGYMDAYGAVKRASDLVGFGVKAPSETRMSAPLDVEFTGPVTKTSFENSPTEVVIEGRTPVAWGVPTDIEFDPDQRTADWEMGEPEIREDQWVISITCTYYDPVEEASPSMSYNIRPVGEVGDSEMIEGSVMINGVSHEMEPNRVTITLASLPPDLSIVPLAISFSQSRPQGGDEVTISVKVNNTGSTDADDALIRVVDGPEDSGRLVGEARSNVLSGSYAIVKFNWVASAGVHTITAIADPEDEIIESNEFNNSAERPYTVRGINPKPVASLKVSPAEGNIMTKFRFNGSESEDTNLVGGAVVSYNFDYGDGSSSGWINTPTIFHRYTSSGQYTASLMVMDNGGATSENEASMNINVSEVEANRRVLFLNGSYSLAEEVGTPFEIEVPTAEEPSLIGTWESDPEKRSISLVVPAELTLFVRSDEETTVRARAELSSLNGSHVASGTLNHPGSGEETELVLSLLSDELEVRAMDHISLDIHISSEGGNCQLLGGPGQSRLAISYYTIPNVPPDVDAGPDREVKVGQVVGFKGSSGDPDGEVIDHRWDVDGDGIWEKEGADSRSYDYPGYEREGLFTAVYEAMDNDGAWSRDTAKITVRPEDYNFPPKISILCENGTIVEGFHDITGEASDDVEVESVWIKITDDSGVEVVPWTTVQGTREWSYTWDTTRSPDGAHLIEARSYDGKIYSDIASCSVTVDNPAHSPIITAVDYYPSPYPLGSGEELVISAQIFDLDMPDDILTVNVDLEDLGGPDKIPMLDDGTGYDSDPSDGTFTASFLPDVILAPGTIRTNITVSDSEGSVSRKEIDIETVLNINVRTEIPRKVRSGEEFEIEVTVRPYDGNTEVILDPNGLTEIGTTYLNDVGLEGDELAGDGVYTASIKISETTGFVNFVIEVRDVQGSRLWTGSSRISVEEKVTEEGETQMVAVLVTAGIGAIIVAVAAGFVFALIRTRGSRRKEDGDTEDKPPISYQTERNTGSDSGQFPGDRAVPAVVVD